MIVYDSLSPPLGGAIDGFMRWLTFFLLLYVMMAAQTSRLGGIPSTPAAGGAAIGSTVIWPYIEFVPLLAVFYALYASAEGAPLAALFCGLSYDLAQMDFVGTSLIPMALVGWLIVRIRLSIFREHFISQVVITLLGVLAFAAMSVVFRRLIGASLEGNSMIGHFGYHAGNALYTAMVAPVLFYLFFRIQHMLGFTSHGPRMRPHG
jgi:rod shape-determining protein MreD